MHFPKVTIVDKKNFYTKFFFVAQFFNLPRATGTPRTCKRNGHIINFFKYSRVTPHWKDNFKQIQENIRKIHKKATEVNKVHRFIYNMCMTGNSQFCTVFPVVCAFLGDVVFFKLYILALYLKPSIHPTLNTPISKRTLKMVHFISFVI